jgi:hypothetical protein
MAGGAARPTVLRRLSRTLPKMRDRHRASRTCRAGAPACCAPEGAGQEAVTMTTMSVARIAETLQRDFRSAASQLRQTGRRLRTTSLSRGVESVGGGEASSKTLLPAGPPCRFLSADNRKKRPSLFGVKPS